MAFRPGAKGCDRRHRASERSAGSGEISESPRVRGQLLLGASRLSKPGSRAWASSHGKAPPDAAPSDVSRDDPEESAHHTQDGGRLLPCPPESEATSCRPPAPSDAPERPLGRADLSHLPGPWLRCRCVGRCDRYRGANPRRTSARHPARLRCHLPGAGRRQVLPAGYPGPAACTENGGITGAATGGALLPAGGSAAKARPARAACHAPP